MLHHRPRHPVVRVLREVFYVLYNPIKKIYHYTVRPKTKGVKALVQRGGKYLFVRIGYGHKQWVVPGGAVDRGEEAIDAARRELQEETGIQIKDLILFGERTSSIEYKRDTVYCYYGTATSDDLYIDDQEIVDAGWFSPEALPENRSPGVDEVISLYNTWKAKNED